MITFELTKEQKLIQKTAKEFAGGELTDIARDCDEEADTPKKMLDKASELGLANAAVPEAYGGIGMERSAVTSVLVCEELGYGCAGLASAIMAPTGFIQPLIDFGSDSQKEKYLPPYAGETFEPTAMALHESHFTFDPTDLRTSAEQKGNKWILNGIKRLVPFGQSANHFLVIAKSGNGNGRLINSIRIGNSALCLGISRAVLEYSVPYAKDRIAFGEPIGKKQAIAFMLADMHIETESMRALVWKAASQLDQNVDATKATTLAQYYVNKHAVRIADNGVQIFGGHGYIRDYPLEMWLRNARTLTVMEGFVAA
ncbi:MAG: acyl-CoA dehydrogenase family protein [Deltaproteobacteria bacterium]|nr:acyl-CoA dehydrogenase family protein [Deltaproteobacteria bacterium]